MKIRHILFITCLCLLAMAFRADSWQTVRCETGKCSSLMPGEPEYSVEAVETEAGPLDMHMYVYAIDEEGQDENLAYGMFYTQMPEHLSVAKGAPDEDTKERLNNARDGAVNNVGGVIKSEKIISYKGYPGIDFTCDIEMEDGTYTAAMQMIFVKDRMYQLQVISFGDQIPNASSKKFMQSFKVEDL